MQGLEAPEPAAGPGDWADHTVAAGLALGAAADGWQIDLCPPAKRSCFRITGEHGAAPRRGRRGDRRAARGLERALRPGTAPVSAAPSPRRRRPSAGWRRRSASSATLRKLSTDLENGRKAGAVGPRRRRVLDPVPRRLRPPHAVGGVDPVVQRADHSDQAPGGTAVAASTASAKKASTSKDKALDPAEAPKAAGSATPASGAAAASAPCRSPSPASISPTRPTGCARSEKDPSLSGGHDHRSRDEDPEGAAGTVGLQLVGDDHTGGPFRSGGPAGKGGTVKPGRRSAKQPPAARRSGGNGRDRPGRHGRPRSPVRLEQLLPGAEGRGEGCRPARNWSPPASRNSTSVGT